MSRASISLLFLGALLFCVPTFAADSITETAAMRRAEDYIRANGYTDATPTKTTIQLDPESFERTPRERWLSERAGLLESRAWGYRRGARSDSTEGWSVIFRIRKTPSYKVKPNESAYGKVVEMDKRGNKLLVLHGCVVAYGSPEFAGYTRRTDLHPR